MKVRFGPDFPELRSLQRARHRKCRSKGFLLVKHYLSYQPKVSIIVPNYNHIKFLEQRFSTIFDQTFQDFEIIFLDDASKDNSLEVFMKFSKHSKITKTILNEKNSGSPYLQWNRGIVEAHGDYIWIAESDDFAHPEFLETMVAILDRNPRVGIAFCQSVKVDEAGQVIGSTLDWTAELGAELWSKDFIAPGREECGKFLIRKCMIPNVSSALIRKAPLSSVGNAHDAMRYCGDYFTYAKLLEISDLAYISKPLNYFRFSSNTVRSKMAHSWLHEYERAEVLAYVSEKFPLSIKEKSEANHAYIEKLLRGSFYDWRFAWAWMSRILKFHGPINKFCPRFEFKIISLGFRLASRHLKNVIFSI